MRVTSKGQVTIPVALRRKYGIEPDSEVEFIEGTHGPEIVRKFDEADLSRGRRVVEALKRAGELADRSLTTAQIMATTRGWGEDDPGFYPGAAADSDQGEYVPAR